MYSSLDQLTNIVIIEIISGETRNNIISSDNSTKKAVLKKIVVTSLVLLVKGKNKKMTHHRHQSFLCHHCITAKHDEREKFETYSIVVYTGIITHGTYCCKLRKGIKLLGVYFLAIQGAGQEMNHLTQISALLQHRYFTAR